jgi:hypothetical protein
MGCTSAGHQARGCRVLPYGFVFCQHGHAVWRRIASISTTTGRNLRISDDESLFAWVDKGAKADELHGLLADSPLQFQDSGCIGPRRSQHTEKKAWQTTNVGLNIQRSLVSGQMPLICGYRGQAGYLSVAKTPMGDQYARCNLAELQGCMDLIPSGNLFFPQIIPHIDRFHPSHETIIRYSFSVSTRTTQTGIYV